MSLLGELISQVIGEAAVEVFVGSRKPRHPFPEGETNASYGAAAAFFGTIGPMFALPMAILASFWGPSSDMPISAILTLTVVGLLSSVAGIRLGARAPLVTRRNLGLAKYGFVAASIGGLSSIVALVASAVRAIL